MAPLTTGHSENMQMIKESVGELSSSSKNSSRVKDLIKKLNEGSQELSKCNGQTGNTKVANALTNSSKKTATQDVLDVRKKSTDAANRIGGIIVDLDVTDKENKLPQIVDLETMYSLLAEKHSELLCAYNGMQVQQLKDSTLRKDKREIQRLTKTNNDLLSEINKLQTQLKESVEHNELLEFRLLELEDTETTNKLKSQNRETVEDMSDSGVMSLTTSDDYCSEGDQQEYDLDIRRCDNIKQRLMEMCNSVCYCVEDRSTIQQVLGLIRHFECRLTEANHNDRHKPPVYADCLQESGIFEEDVLYPEATQTELPADKAANEVLLSTDLTEELRKLSRIREKIEERKVPLVDDRAAKELSFYKDRWQVLEKKVEAYESDGDRKIRLLATSIDRESRLSNELKNAYTTVDKLKEQNRLLEEEKCEFEEAENDTRLRCQKLESKFLTLAEKKNSLQAELVEKSKETEKLRQELAEVDAKKYEARKHAATMEALVNKYEQRNFELEESQMETKCKLQLLENAWPAIVLWNIWRVVCKHYRKSKPVKAIEHKTGPELVDVDYLEKLRIITKEKMDLEKQIQDLQLKENVYQQTLQQADHILANVEDGYKRQIDELNSELAEKQKLLLDRENRMRISADSRDREAELLDRVHGLETEVRDLTHKIKTKDIEKQSWARREAQLRNDMEQLVNDVCQVKSENGQLKTLLDCEKMKLRDLQKDISFKQSVYAEMEEKSNLEAKSYQTTILKLSKQIDEYDVTNGELKEEVETLEAHVKHLRNALAEEKEAKESMNIELNQELSRKQEVIDGLERHLSYRGSKNAAEELLCENVNTNVGKLNFDEINLSDNLLSALQFSKIKQLKTCDGCAKNVEPKLQTLFNQFDNIMTMVDRTNNTTAGACCSPRNVEDCPKSECPMSSKCSAADRLTVCDLTKQAVMLEAKNEEKNKIIMMLADELIYLAERAKWDRQCVIAQGLNSIPSTRFAPDFNCTTVEKYLNGRNVKSVQDGNIEDNKYRCLIGPDNPIGLHVVRQIGPDGIILAWKSPAPDTISSFQVFLNGELVQSIQNPGRSTTLLHPVNLQEPITITMNAVKQDGIAFPPIAICHPYGV
ncbi:putative leucine-rich repeat-containing protein DDB_G0290503 isoform X2 [Adelges cooleyi]|uniref:putative leucine-rich repeat-containing protein DDB_G0290503 isoform X2 n=1 Tax=Adelges cooleyi TaxID=133065 RepID=UPI00217F41F2|nr:putative leucine-rich repeat-containing protein DDB_G0290503 isoform X2 [Adelges cooleyi]